ncbi:MAG: hypothetical protein WC451_04435 [Patescibacteria group bacterium]
MTDDMNPTPTPGAVPAVPTSDNAAGIPADSVGTPTDDQTQAAPVANPMAATPAPAADMAPAAAPADAPAPVAPAVSAEPVDDALVAAPEMSAIGGPAMDQNPQSVEEVPDAPVEDAGTPPAPTA